MKTNKIVFASALKSKAKSNRNRSYFKNENKKNRIRSYFKNENKKIAFASTL